MLFSAPLFIPFLFVVIAVFYALRFSFRLQKYWIIAASLVFYGFFDFRYVILLIAVTVLNWVCVLAIGRRGALEKPALIASVVISLGALGIFKYLGLFVDTVNSVAETAGGVRVFSPVDIILPVGVSFYLFQSMSYVIDLARGKIEKTGTFSDFLFFVVFFPQLVAGPIVRAESFLPQIELKRRISIDQAMWGLSLFIIGLFQKIVLADGVFAPVANDFFAQSRYGGFFEAWCGVFAFAGQIYCDFSGYSSCAIGVSLLFGYRIPLNFNLPYGAIGFSDFWRRWHISLSSWLRDYLYISLGGNRRGAFNTYRNLMLTMLLGGLWHGAAWTFVLWGGLHGAFLVIERLLKTYIPVSAPKTAVFAIIGSAFGWLVTLLGVMVAWVPFRAADLSRSTDIMMAMFRPVSFAATVFEDPGQRLMLFAFSALLIFSVRFRNTDFWTYWGRYPAAVKGMALGGMITAILAWRGDSVDFIYFQF
ncbi:MAG: MBOAT family O-acyltransferase [Parvularculaceae bacterium]